MRFLNPLTLPFEISDWNKQDSDIKIKMLCKAWATQGYGAPITIYLVYLIKIVFYIAMWFLFCSFSTELGSFESISAWWFKKEALFRAIIWSILFEVIGLGCGSLPLTGRYFPPFSALFHFVRPGTIKLPLFKTVSFLKADKRSIFDVLLYVLLLGTLVLSLISSTVNVNYILIITITIPLLGIIDKTIFLAARAEHYWVALICFLFIPDTLSALKWVWVSIWWGAAFSKLNHHFPSVVAVMISNHPFIKWNWFKKKMYQNYPKDLRPSGIAKSIAHIGTLVEFLFPLLLIFGNGGVITLIGIGIMLVFHLHITSSVPMGVPLEWNFLMVFGALLLFGYQASVPMFAIQSIPLIIFLISFSIVLPIIGNLKPDKISFLLSMRYYAGNWPYSIYLFKGSAEEKMDKYIKKTSKTWLKQLDLFYDRETATITLSKVIAFRLMHLQGRLLQNVILNAVDDLEDYTWRDGELVAGIVLGWNFGDGHLHNEQLLASIQKRCNYKPGELRCIFVEPQALFKNTMEWRIVDAADGEINRGKTLIKEMLKKQPWN